jgi:uncharacterized damage-inducible protein DinB
MSRIDFVTGAPQKYAHLVDSLATVPDRLRRAVAGRSAGDLRREPAGGDWSAQRVLAHLAVYAHHNGVFIHRMVTMWDPERAAFDEDALIDQHGYLRMEPNDLLQLIDDEVSKTVDFLSETPDAAWGRRGMVAGASRSVRQQVQRHIDHFQEHIDQVAALLDTREQVEATAEAE